MLRERVLVRTVGIYVCASSEGTFWRRSLHRTSQRLLLKLGFARGWFRNRSWVCAGTVLPKERVEPLPHPRKQPAGIVRNCFKTLGLEKLITCLLSSLFRVCTNAIEMIMFRI